MSVSLDFETRSKTSIQKAGAYRYLEDPSARIMCLAFSIDGAEPLLWHPGYPLVPGELDDPTASFMLPSEQGLEELFERIHEGDELWAFNAAFERAVFTIIGGPKHGWPVPKPEQWRCVQAMAASVALPLSLDGVCAALGLKQKKWDEGKKIMQRLTKPRAPSKNNKSLWNENPEDLLKLFKYCRQDVRAEMGVHKVLRELPEAEQRIYFVDQAINFRGVAIDLDLCRAADRAVKKRAGKMAAEVKQITGGEVSSYTEVAKAKVWLATKGVEIADMTKETVRDTLAADDECRALNLKLEPGEREPGIHEDARRFLEIRAAAGKTSVAKYAKLLATTSADGRLRGGYQYHGADTGRWAGRGPQLHNFPKGATLDEQTEVIETVMMGGLDLMELIYRKPIDELSRVLRGAIIAPPGKKLVVADYCQIEARGVLWLAGQEDLLDVFRRGGDPYCAMAEKIFERNAADIRADYLDGHPDGVMQRFTGKQTVLGCGYGMGWKRFVEHCWNVAEVRIPPKLGKRAIKAYRIGAPLVPKLWKLTEAAAIKAVDNPGLQVQAKRTAWKMVGRFLHCKLPSGRLLSYYRPFIRLETVRRPEEIDEDGVVTPAQSWQTRRLYYHAQRHNRFGVTSTFGGSLVENVCQATSRDLMADAMIRLEKMGAPITIHSHDEIVIEVPENGDWGPSRLESFMELAPAWADGLPVKVEAWSGKRYRK